MMTEVVDSLRGGEEGQFSKPVDTRRCLVNYDLALSGCRNPLLGGGKAFGDLLHFMCRIPNT